jgi:hypothetical protein
MPFSINIKRGWIGRSIGIKRRRGFRRGRRFGENIRFDKYKRMKMVFDINEVATRGGQEAMSITKEKTSDG